MNERMSRWKHKHTLFIPSYYELYGNSKCKGLESRFWPKCGSLEQECPSILGKKAGEKCDKSSPQTLLSLQTGQLSGEAFWLPGKILCGALLENKLLNSELLVFQSL